VNDEVLAKVLLRLSLTGLAMIHEMKGVKILEFRIAPVYREAATQTVGSVMHESYRPDDLLAIECGTGPVHDPTDCAP
jgi:hypothetical protein